MLAKLFFLLLLLSCNTSAFSQGDENDSTKAKVFNRVILIPDKKLNERIKLSLRAYQASIKLLTHPRVALDSNNYKVYSELFSTFSAKDNIKIIDSVSITLKSGLAWNLAGKPPEAPKHFHIKLLTKKGRMDKSVTDWLKYLEFYTRWSERNEIPFEMIEKFDRYYAIFDNEVKLLEMSYELRFVAERRMRITNSEINY